MRALRRVQGVLLTEGGTAGCTHGRGSARVSTGEASRQEGRGTACRCSSSHRRETPRVTPSEHCEGHGDGRTAGRRHRTMAQTQRCYGAAHGHASW